MQKMLENTTSTNLLQSKMQTSATQTKALYEIANLRTFIATLNSRLLLFSAHSSNSATGIMGNQAADNDRFHYLD